MTFNTTGAIAPNWQDLYHAAMEQLSERTEALDGTKEALKEELQRGAETKAALERVKLEHQNCAAYVGGQEALTALESELDALLQVKNG